LALPDLDPSVALAQAAQQDFARKFVADHHATDQLVWLGKRDRFAGVLWAFFGALVTSPFRTSADMTGSVRSDGQ
jgi:hypothetical protein